MHSEIEKISETRAKLQITAGEEDLKGYRQAVLARLANDVKLDGFRKGTAPAALVEKYVDQNVLQREFLDEAMSGLYTQAAMAKKIRPVGQPEVTVKKFVPFSALEFEIAVDMIGELKLGDYKKVKLAPEKATTTAKDVEQVLTSLKSRAAERKEISRAVKLGDEAVIDFKGTDSKGQPVNGAEGKDYPLVLGSKSFIPGFEDNLIGLKPGDEKSFELTFPKDYGVKALANKKVSFGVTVKKVLEIKEPTLDDKFAAQVGPFKTLKDLKDDIKKQLTLEKQNELNRDYQNRLVAQIADKSSVAIPESMIKHQVEHSLQEVKRNLTYRGQTYQEFLDQEGLSEQAYTETVLKPQAEQQIKTSLVLSAIAEAENLTVTMEELEVRLQLLKGQYQSDKLMQAELDKPENRQDIANRMLIDKVLQLLTTSATQS